MVKKVSTAARLVGENPDCLLMAALQYVYEADYSAILFRRTFSDLSLSGALMDRAKEWCLDAQV
jgi:hypothetical protein